MWCTQCGTENPSENKFCKECGAKISSPGNSSTEVEGNGNGHGALTFAEKVQRVEEALAGLDCGRCGYKTCAENAAAIVRGVSPYDSCVQGASEAARTIERILGAPERQTLGAALWNTLTSVKLAVGLIIALTLLSIVGTVIPQGQNDLVYANRYGMTGYKIIKILSLDALYRSWYYLGLLFLLATNTAACLIKRYKVSYQFLTQPQEERTAQQILKLENSATLPLRPGSIRLTLDKTAEVLKSMRYRLDISETQIKGRKHLWGRLGVDLFHASLILVLIGALVGGLLSFEYFQVAHKGETFDVAQGGFSVRVDDLWTENYAESARIKDWYTKLTVLDEGRAVMTQTIEVNKPLTYKGISFYQSSFGSDWFGGAELTFTVEGADKTPVGEYRVKVGNSFAFGTETGSLRVEVKAFFPDFVVGEQGPANRSQRLQNPAALLDIYEATEKKFSTWVFSQYPEFQHQFFAQNPYRFYLTGMTAPEFTGLQVARNPGIPLVYAGFFLMALGMFFNFYLPPRRVWALVQDKSLYIGGLGRDEREFMSEFEAMQGRLQEELPAAEAEPEPLKQEPALEVAQRRG